MSVIKKEKTKPWPDLADMSITRTLNVNELHDYKNNYEKLMSWLSNLLKFYSAINNVR